MERALIIADLEGIAGVSDLAEFKQCRDLYNEEISIVVKALKDEGVQEIVVCDIHNNGDMLDTMVNNVTYISKLWNIPLNKQYSFALLCGLHGMAGSKCRFPHSFRMEIKSITTEAGNPIGEVGAFCRWLGHMKIPVITVFGDLESNEEAKADCINRLVCTWEDNIELNISGYYQKIKDSVSKAIKLNFSTCISSDEERIQISFAHPDILATMGSSNTIIDNYICYKDCYDFVLSLKDFCINLNEALITISKKNMQFINNVKPILEKYKKNSIELNQIEYLLAKDIWNLNEYDRITINQFLNEIEKQKM